MISQNKNINSREKISKGADDFNTEVEDSNLSKNKIMKSALKRKYRRKQSSRHIYGDNTEYYDDSSIDSSPLLSSTPPNISRALIKLYPYLIVADKVLSFLTWSNDDTWPNYLIIVLFIICTNYFDFIVKYFGQLIIIGLLWVYSLMDKSVSQTVSAYPTLDDIVHVMGRISKKADLILAPVRVLSLQDIKRLFFTITFFLPLYVILSVFIVTSKNLFLLGGLYALTYHSMWGKMLRRSLWNIRIVRLFSFYVTGLDLGGINKHQGIFINVSEQMRSASFSNKDTDSKDGNNEKTKSIRFTYALYENQRRWLGIGWTSSMLSYERAAWTDAYLNPAPALHSFKLPDNDSDMKWQWVDEVWSLDRTNDGALQLSKNEEQLVSSPNATDGYIYSDNTWNNPSTEDTFTKYTRRRRWVRTAELINTSLLISSEKHGSEEDDKQKTKENQPSDENSEDKQTESEHSKKSKDVHDRQVSFSDVHKVRIIPANKNRHYGNFYSYSGEDNQDDSHSSDYIEEIDTSQNSSDDYEIRSRKIEDENEDHNEQ